VYFCVLRIPKPNFRKMESARSFLEKSSFVCFSVLIFLFLVGNINAQQYDIVYFGDKAGLNFSTNPPAVLTNSQMIAPEGCSTISDGNGNLLFYTNGQTVWNKNHTIMSNGTGLSGGASSMETLILPKPGSTTLYYIFTVDEVGGSGGLRYSLVDMTLAGGNGGVVASSKNVLIRTPTTEKITAIKRCDGNFWVLSHGWNSNAFYADLLDASGFSSTVTSNVGTVHQNGTGPNGNGVNAVGRMVFSEQGDRIGLAIRNMNVFEVYDFDKNTGVVSNPIALSSPSYNTAYGVAFSPDGSKLYGTVIASASLYQFDLQAGSQAQIATSSTLVGTFSNLAGGVFLGKDGKLYISNMIGQLNGKLNMGVVDFPNNPAAICGFSASGINLGGKKCLVGVPNFPVIFNGGGLFITPPARNQTICKGDTLLLSPTGTNPAIQYQWTGGVQANTKDISVFPSVSTDYYLESSDGTCSQFDTVTVEVIAGDHLFPPDTSSCQPVTLVLPGSYQNIFWNGQAGGSSYLIDSSEVVVVSATHAQSGCAIQDTIDVLIDHYPNITLPFRFQTICLGDSVTIVPSGGNSGTQYSWSGGASASTASLTVSPTSTTDYYLESSNGNCSVFDTVSIEVVNIQIDLLPPDTTSCEAVVLTIDNTYQNIRWNGIVSSNSFIADSTQQIWVEAVDPGSGCVIRDTIHVQLQFNLPDSLTPKIYFEEPTCAEGLVHLSIGNGNNRFTYYWDFGNGIQGEGAEQIAIYASSGVYLVQLYAIDSVCNITLKDSVYIHSDGEAKGPFVPNVFTPNGDGKNEKFFIGGTPCGYGSSMRIYSRWGELLFSTDRPFEVFWDGQYRGEPVPEGVYYYVLNTGSKVFRNYLTLFR
jgi:gliding motility-associated-like protein